MIKSNKSLLITFSLLLGLFVFPIINTNLAMAVAPVPLPGCCTTEEGESGQCVGCPEGEICFASSSYCEAEGTSFTEGACTNVGEGAMCIAVKASEGCCVINEGQCTEDTDIESCFLGTPGGPEIFVSEASCSVVPQCTLTRNVPALSNWALVALAAVFTLAGIWAIARKRAAA